MQLGPDKPPNSGECYNCGDAGHNKAECPNPRVEREFTGSCRFCEQVGHRANECPEKPPAVCKVCNKEGMWSPATIPSNVCSSR